MREDLLHFVWRWQRFDQKELVTTSGETIQIQQVGIWNQQDGGPDFKNARIKIGDTLWAGNIEMHVKASDWYKHKHDEDKAYNNVVLHVVLENDQVIYRKNGQAIPCLNLKKRLSASILATYQKLLHNQHWIPCQHFFYQVKPITKNMWLSRLAAERIEEKTITIKRVLDTLKNDWENTFYRFIARYFGGKINNDTFELLAQKTPQLLLAKHKNNLLQIEALLFGQAGLLEQDFEDKYPNQLKSEYAFLRKKYQLTPIPATMWQFLRLRPANFPSIRLSEFAALSHKSVHLFSKILEVTEVEQLFSLFHVEVSSYWETHYVFDKLSKKRKKTFGKKSIELLIINTIVPFLFLYGIEKDAEMYKNRALTFLEQLSPEHNSIIKKWENLGMNPKSAYDTQALLQLKNNYCATQNCLNCAIGTSIIKNAPHHAIQ